MASNAFVEYYMTGVIHKNDSPGPLSTGTNMRFRASLSHIPARSICNPNTSDFFAVFLQSYHTSLLITHTRLRCLRRRVSLSLRGRSGLTDGEALQPLAKWFQPMYTGSTPQFRGTPLLKIRNPKCGPSEQLSHPENGLVAPNIEHSHRHPGFRAPTQIICDPKLCPK